MEYNACYANNEVGDEMKQKRTAWIYRILRKIVYTVYPKVDSEGVENLPDEPVIVVGNHSQLHGPIISELHFPAKNYTWCAGPMMKLKEVPAYAFEDFWSFKPWYSRWLYRIVSYLIAPLAVVIFNNAHTIAVHRDARLFSTFKQTVQRLQEGNHVVIFPEHNQKYNHIVYDFEDRFIDIAKLYHKKTGKELQFVPLYIAPNLKQMHFGEPIRFCADRPIEEERQRIREYLMTAITDIACALPEHTVIPYRNIPKREYPCNRAREERNDAEAGR